MRGTIGIGSLIAMSMMAHSEPLAAAPVLIADKPQGISKTKKLPKTGKRYPYSSDRQNARYARQIKAGQLRFVA
ncbi:hypothetical protein G8E10_09430 [Rhizobiaceae bacterium CRRU44]|uniref:Uncharacterized protein n=1 Tax=Ferranicluibacter rubi TaxID=2715133 RepID=A0AA43ZF97_9HYPH|nr:hypothetical protein [Ferranicluibacter rubi]NHT75900.1 hypothetical protein [Ferranicluibacter rubi]NHT75960.1 hypothetical protein [Ferranicluibacter rubi]